MNPEEISYIILTFILLSAFISIFFFTYVANIEQTVIKTQITKTINDFVKSSTLILSDEQIENIGTIILNALPNPGMDKDDSDAAKNNSDLLKKTIIAFSSLVGVGIILIAILWYKYRFNFLRVLKYSLLILIALAFTEFLFVTFVTKNYILLDPNFLNYLIIKNLQDYSKMN